MKAKYKGAHEYIGRVGRKAVHALGRTKREAVRRIRLIFARAGIQTQPDAITDLLQIEGGVGVGYRHRHPEKPHNWQAQSVDIGTIDVRPVPSPPKPES
jgi:hypothetical protein